MRIVGLVLFALAWLIAACVGPPATPTPVKMIAPVECIGVPAQTCQEIVTDARRNAQPGVFLVHVRAVCTRQPACTLAEGEVTIDAQYTDGSTQSSGMGWSGAIDPALPPPPEPTIVAPPPESAVPSD
jgi:hypothetical protein